MLIGAAIAIALVVPLGVYAVVKSGLYNVGASEPHTKLTEWLTHDTMIHSVKRNAAALGAPHAFASEQIRAGFCAYEAHCVACHGAARIARQPWASGLEPAPPYLLDATSNWTAPQLFWIVKNGIKMTGMPSWRGSMPDAEIWNVVGFIEAMRQLPPGTFADWRSGRRCAR